LNGSEANLENAINLIINFGKLSGEKLNQINRILFSLVNVDETIQ